MTNVEENKSVTVFNMTNVEEKVSLVLIIQFYMKDMSMHILLYKWTVSGWLV